MVVDIDSCDVIRYLRKMENKPVYIQQRRMLRMLPVLGKYAVGFAALIILLAGMFGGVYGK